MRIARAEGALLAHKTSSPPELGHPAARQVTAAHVSLDSGRFCQAAALETEDHAPTVANHLAFEADARVVRAEAQKILTTPALLPATNRAGYERMLKDFITVANLLQPGPGYGTTAQDDTAWYTAMNASNITVAYSGEPSPPPVLHRSPGQGGQL